MSLCFIESPLTFWVGKVVEEVYNGVLLVLRVDSTMNQIFSMILKLNLFVLLGGEVTVVNLGDHKMYLRQKGNWQIDYKL